MNFQWPQNLWLMLALPLLAALYLWLLRRRGKPALRLSSLSVVRQASGRAWRRHAPPALFLLALAVLLLALKWADRATAWRLHEVLVDQFIASQLRSP